MRHLVMIVGTGGMGSLTAGRILVDAALLHYAHSAWFPSYDGRQRGGPAECTVILSNEEICAPFALNLEALVMMHPSQVARFKDRVIPGGLSIVGQGCSLNRSDIKELEIPAEETARRVGSMAVVNQVFIGAYVKATGCLPPESVERVLEGRFAGRPAVLEMNKRAYREGMRLAE